MNKTLFRLLFFEGLERLARCAGLIQWVAHEIPDAVDQGAVALLESRFDALKAQWLSDQDLQACILTDRPIRESDPLNRLAHLLAQQATGLNALARLLNQLCPGLPRTEWAHVWADWAPGLPVRTTLLAPASDLSDPELCQLGILDRDNPLAWLPLARAAVSDLSRKANLTPLWVQGPLARMNGKSPVAADLAIDHSLALRLAGPGYYLATVLDALVQRDGRVLFGVEPLLFQGLNHFGFVDKSLVILHEVCEKARESHFLEPNLPVDQRPVLRQPWVGDWFQAVEAAIPQRLAFSDKSFRRALELQDRLDRGVIVSSAHLYPLDDVLPEVLETLQSGPQTDGVTVYDLLGRVAEVPNTPREVMTAGWLFRMQRYAVWLYQALNDADGFDAFRQRVVVQDQRLLKSIETAEVHRALLQAV